MEEFEDKTNEEEQQQAVANDSSSSTPTETQTDVIDQSAEAEEVCALQDSIDGTEEETVEQKGLVGNAEGAQALVDTADKLEALLSDEQIESLGITDEEKLHFKEIIAGARAYATEGKVMLVTDMNSVAPDIAHHLGAAVACYSVTDDFIYLLRGPQSNDDLNTIVHEVSHALDKDSPDTLRLLNLNVEHGQLPDNEEEPGKKEYNTAEDQLLGLDFQLSLTRVELKSEIDGKIAEQISRNDETDGHESERYVTAIAMWRSGKIKDGSAKAAYDTWNDILDDIALEEKNTGLVLRQPDYNNEAELYLIGEGAFPEAKTFRIE